VEQERRDVGVFAHVFGLTIASWNTLSSTAGRLLQLQPEKHVTETRQSRAKATGGGLFEDEACTAELLPIRKKGLHPPPRPTPPSSPDPKGAQVRVRTARRRNQGIGECEIGARRNRFSAHPPELGDCWDRVEKLGKDVRPTIIDGAGGRSSERLARKPREQESSAVDVGGQFLSVRHRSFRHTAPRLR